MDVIVGKVHRRWKNSEHLTLEEVMYIQTLIDDPEKDDVHIHEYLTLRGYNPPDVIAHMEDVARQWASLTVEERREKIRKNMYRELGKQERERLRKMGIETPWDISVDPNNPTQLDLDLGDV